MEDVLIKMLGLSAELYDQLTAIGRKKRYEKGDVILRPDERKSLLFFLDKGFVRAFRLMDVGESRNTSKPHFPTVLFIFIGHWYGDASFGVVC